MPITAGRSLLNNQIKSALSKGKSADINTTSQEITNAIASVVGMGIFPTSPSPLPLKALGKSAAKSLIKNALNMGRGANINTTAQMIATAISLIAPIVPPKGFSALKTALKNALSAGKGATIKNTANQFSAAIINYFSSGGVK